VIEDPSLHHARQAFCCLETAEIAAWGSQGGLQYCAEHAVRMRRQAQTGAADAGAHEQMRAPKRPAGSIKCPGGWGGRGVGGGVGGWGGGS
jgi:hypothetical protein